MNNNLCFVLDWNDTTEYWHNIVMYDKDQRDSVGLDLIKILQKAPFASRTSFQLV